MDALVGPLHGIRVVELSLMVAGPTCGLLLAQLGAEVIKIETASRGESGRAGWRWTETNGGKLGVSLNLKHPDGIALLKNLLRASDVFFYNMRQQALDRLGLDAETLLRDVNPSLVILAMSAAGATGPEQNFSGVATTFVALGGVSHLSGYPGQAPFELIAWPDVGTSNWGIVALTSALLARNRTGQGCFLDLSANEGYAWLCGETFMDVAMNGRSPGRDGHFPPTLLQGTYRSLGDEPRYISIAAGSDAEWRILCAELGQPDLAADPRFATAPARLAHRAEIDALIGAWVAGHDNVALAERLQARGVAAVPVFCSAELSTSPHLQQRGSYQTLTHPLTGTAITQVGPPWRFSNTPAASHRAGPLLGEHNEYVFGELLGLPDEKRERLITSGVIV